MKALGSLFAYLFTGLAGIGIAAYFSSFLLEPTKASVSNNEELIKPKAKVIAGVKRGDQKSLLKESESVLVAQNQVPTPPAPQPATNAPTEAPSLQQSDIVVEGRKQREKDLRLLQDSFEYNPEGKRDPFMPYEAPTAILDSAKPIGPVKPLQKFSVEQLKVQGIIWGVEDPIAMVEAPNKKIYYVREREKIGNNNGYVAQIREGELVIVESFVHRGNITSQVKVLPIHKKNNKK
jgi:type IV pilus assembly protein PilP